MQIENQKSSGQQPPAISRRNFLRGAGVFSLAFLMACDFAKEPQKKLKVTPPPTAVDFLRPMTHEEGANFFAYKQGVVVNLTKGVTLGMLTDNLVRVNSDPAYGIGLGNGEINFTFLLPQSFATEEGRQQASQAVNHEFPSAVAVYHRNNPTSNSGRLRFSILSVADSLSTLSRNNPGISPYSAVFIEAAGTELSSDYLAVSKSKNTDPEHIPAEYLVTDQERLALIPDLAYPFRLLVIDSAYLDALRSWHNQDKSNKI